MSFFAELKRRNVVRMGIAYVLVAWLLLQGVDFALDVAASTSPPPPPPPPPPVAAGGGGGGGGTMSWAWLLALVLAVVALFTPARRAPARRKTSTR